MKVDGTIRKESWRLLAGLPGPCAPDLLGCRTGASGLLHKGGGGDLRGIKAWRAGLNSHTHTV